MGKPIVKRHAPSLNAQSVWREFESHVSTSSKGLNERQRFDTIPTKNGRELVEI